VGIWPKPADYIEIKKAVIGLQKETDEVLFSQDIFILTQMHKIRDAEGQFGFWDIGRIALRYGIDIFEVCQFIDSQINPRPTIRQRIERTGLEQFFEGTRLHDAQCKMPILDKE